MCEAYEDCKIIVAWDQENGMDVEELVERLLDYVEGYALSVVLDNIGNATLVVCPGEWLSNDQAAEVIKEKLSPRRLDRLYDRKRHPA